MKHWDTSCIDWERRIVAGRSLIPFSPLFPSEAEAALAVFKSLRIVDVPGKPTFGEACEQWVFDFVAAIFGAYDAETGQRLISKFFLLISKKNSKSTIAAGIMITALLRNWRFSAELLILAPTLEVAQNSFKPAADMVAADEDLRKLLHVQDHLRTITHRTTGAVLKVVAADKDTVGGKKAAFVLVDEYWIFGSKPKADAMLREATGGLVSRPEGFVIWITTQSDEPPAGVFKEGLEYARDVRDGKKVDPKFLPVIYEFPQRMIDAGEHLDPANFYITNPNIGRSVRKDWLQDELRTELGKGPQTRNVFLAKHLNVEIGLSLRSDRWAGANFWQRQALKLDLADLIVRCEVLTVGIDGGGLDDLLSMSVIGRVTGERAKWLHWQHSWMHEGVLELRKSEAARFRDFERDRDLTIVSDMTLAFGDLAQRCADLDATGKLSQIGMDPAGVGLIVDALAIAGVEGDDRIVGVSQGFQLQGAIKTAEVKLASGQLGHCAQPIMAWAVGNAKTELKGNAVMITKQAAGTAKIDPLMSLFDGVALMSKNPEPLGHAIPQIFVL